jgi:hypothetical protein
MSKSRPTLKVSPENEMDILNPLSPILICGEFKSYRSRFYFKLPAA